MKPSRRNSKLKPKLLARCQWTVFVAMFLGYACYTFCRKSVAFALPTLLQHKISTSDAGLITSNQNMAYTLSKFVGGIISDKISSRLLFSAGLLCSAVTTLAFAASDSIYWFSCFWFLNGLALGPGWPSCVKLLRQWYPQTRFGTLWSVLSSSMNLAGVLGPPFAVYIILHHGWRLSLIIAGFMAAAMSIICLLTITDSPKDIGLESFLPTESLQDNNAKGQSSKGSWKYFLRNQLLWTVSISYLIVSCAKTAFSDWAQVYLVEDKQMNPYKASSFVSALEAGGLIGGICTGYITDWITSRNNTGIKINKEDLKVRNGASSSVRLPVATCLTVILCVGLHVFCFHLEASSSEFIILGLGFAIGTSLYGPINIYGMVAIESSPSHLSGTAHSIAALAANVGAMVAGLPLASVVVKYGWSSAFTLLNILVITTILFHVTLMLSNRKNKASKLKQKQ